MGVQAGVCSVVALRLGLRRAILGGQLRRVLTVIGAVGVALVMASVAYAVVTATVGDGTANTDGSATVPVTVSCPGGAKVIEAHLTLSQDDQTIWGMGGIAGIRCNGRPHTYLARVVPVEGAFHAGTAFASPYVLVERRGGKTTESGGAGGTITLE